MCEKSATITEESACDWWRRPLRAALGYLVWPARARAVKRGIPARRPRQPAAPAGGRCPDSGGASPAGAVAGARILGPKCLRRRGFSEAGGIAGRKLAEVSSHCFRAL